MKTLRFIGYLFFRYYSRGKRSNIAYFSSVCAITFLLFLHLLQIILIFKLPNILPHFSYENKFIKKGFIFLMLLLIYFLVKLLFKEKEIEVLKIKYDKDWDKVFKGNVLLIIYSIMSLSFTFLLAINLKK